MRTSDLTGPALDWAVAKCEGFDPFTDGISWIIERIGQYQQLPCYSTDWSQGGPIIERERIQTTPRGETTDLWEAIVFDNIFMDDGSDCFQTGPTPLIAAMRCFVASRLGDEVDIPEELL
jgi:hypothetical protein